MSRARQTQEFRGSLTLSKALARVQGFSAAWLPQTVVPFWFCMWAGASFQGSTLSRDLASPVSRLFSLGSCFSPEGNGTITESQEPCHRPVSLRSRCAPYLGPSPHHMLPACMQAGLT